MPTITIILPGPSGAAINKARRCGCRGRTPYSYPSAEHVVWRAMADAAVESAVGVVGWSMPDGPVTVTITSWWPRVHRTGPAAGMPIGDVDAPVKAVLDALARGGALKDDSQVAIVVASKMIAFPGEAARIDVTVNA